jgi:hypothetical protein
LSSFDNIDNLVSIEKKYDYGPPQDSKNPSSSTTYNVAKDVITKDIADILKEKVY